jgi:AraC family transcriptional regulator of adaptative response / DNA-3-methyladenine glycosylase II
MRIPGAFGGFEVAFRALLGGWPQLFPAAKDVTQRVVESLGEPNDPADPRLGMLLPNAERVVDAGVARLEALGVGRNRAGMLVAIARGVIDGTLRLHAGGDPVATRRALLAVDGVGEQLANTIVMRALSWPDAFPIPDGGTPQVHIGLRSASLEAMAEKWRPWRAYALLHLWTDEERRYATAVRKPRLRRSRTSAEAASA